MVDDVRDVDKPLAKPAVGFKASMDGQRDKGKGCETFWPIGPWFVSKDEIKDRRIWTCGSTSTASSGKAATRARRRNNNFSHARP
jgi:2-keto-4-pentenoate hydratase/2-oxohepta-3-ene-1,7-dioic acid hydratase in catechol pathway